MAVFEESPELHSFHDKSVIGIIIMTETAVEQIYVMKTRHVTNYDVRNLSITTERNMTMLMNNESINVIWKKNTQVWLILKWVLAQNA